MGRQSSPARGFGYVWFTLDQKGLFQVPDREPGIMLLASNGDVLAERGAFFGDEVRVDELPAYVPQAVIAIEDRRFRSHFGVDPMGLVRAPVREFQGRAASSRAARRSPSSSPRTCSSSPSAPCRARLQEAVLACGSRRNFSKDEILQLYLNRVYYGAGATGIEKAAQKFFGKSARDVTLTEAAILAAVLKAPSDYNPVNHPDAAQRARSGGAAGDGRCRLHHPRGGDARRSRIRSRSSLPTMCRRRSISSTMPGEILPQLVEQYDESIVVWTTIDRRDRRRMPKRHCASA